MDKTRGRMWIVGVVVVALMASAATRHWAGVWRGEQRLGAATPLSRMNSYALALLLGGLRGPLVMFLWPSSEGQKSEKNLQDFDTKVEWIRLLQAEFDTVHLFQIWNKAYNISVLMANLPNKYATILDALDYAREVDSERPGNINITSAIASIYGDKLGNSAEKRYYMQRIREETQARRPMMRVTFPLNQRERFRELASAAGARISSMQFIASADNRTYTVLLPKSVADAIRPQFDGEGIAWQERERAATGDRRKAGFRRTELDPMLDEAGNVLPELVQPRPQRAVGSNDGSELQYLKRFEPFPYGLGAHALAYNYHKRSQILFRESNQHHAQLSDLVVDSRPGVSLRDWSEDAWERGLSGEAEAFGKEAPAQPEMTALRMRLAPLTAELPLDSKPKSTAALEQAIFDYERSAQLASEANEEYDEHLKRFSTNFATYRSHQDLLWAHSALTRGDAAYLRLIRGGETDRAALLKSAIDAYSDATRRFHWLLLSYYMDPDSQRLLPERFTREAAEKLSAEELRQLLERLREDVNKRGSGAQHSDEFTEYFTYVRRAEARLALLRQASSAAEQAGVD